MLTAKCKEDFDNWLKREMYYLGNEQLSDLFWMALIIEFFDYNKIYINIKSKYGHRRKKQLFMFNLHNYISPFYESREVATMEAIKSANGFYNSKYSG